MLADADLRARLVAHLGTFTPRPLDGDRRAAVALTVVVGEGGEARVVLTRRRPDLRAHAGQWALPGGRIDAGETARQAALRELAEEVGLVRGHGDVLGVLDDFSSRSGYAITPVVVWGGEPGGLVPSAAEVESIHPIPLAVLDGPGVPRLLPGAHPERPVLQMPLGDQGVVHAPTAAFLYQFREVGLHGRPTRVAHFDQPRFAWR